MADTKWHLEGRWLDCCNCDWGCPCEAEAPPTYGECTGIVGLLIDEGYYGDVRLDGSAIAAMFWFPRALHHGGGRMQPILDEKTNEAQRAAIFKILSGEGQPVGAFFQIMSVIVEKVYEPLFLPIEFKWDIDARRGTLIVPGVVRAASEPIRNPVTDEEHRMVVVLPKAWQFYEAESASGTAKSTGAIKFDFAQRHSGLAYFAYNNQGMAYSYEEAKRKLGTRI